MKKVNRTFNKDSAARAQMASKGNNVCACGKTCGRFTKCLDCFERDKSEHPKPITDKDST